MCSEAAKFMCPGWFAGSNQQDSLRLFGKMESRGSLWPFLSPYFFILVSGTFERISKLISFHDTRHQVAQGHCKAWFPGSDIREMT